MTEQKKETEPTKSAFDFIDLITGRIGKITALLTTIGGLALLTLTQSEQILSKLTSLGWYTPPPCVEVDKPIIPPTVKYSEWESMKIKLKGRTNCPTPLGLYVTFERRGVDARFDLRVPYNDDNPQCKGLPRLQEPKCWDRKINDRKGDWEWDVLPPPLYQLNPVGTEDIIFTWTVYDSASPTKPAFGTGTGTIKVQNDAGNPPL